MIERRIVKRYAAALFAAASKVGVIDQVESDLGLVSLTVESSPQLTEALVSPVVPPETKRQIIDELFTDKVHEITLSYLKLLVDKRREEAIGETEPEYVLLANQARGLVEAEATTAVPLDEAQQKQLTAKLSEVTGKRIELKCSVDPTVIGGVLVRIGDTVIDGSVKGQLEALREQLLG